MAEAPRQGIPLIALAVFGLTSPAVAQDSPRYQVLLRYSRSWHGPYPTDLFAWIHEQRYYPDERMLPVYDYPYKLRLRCEGCETVKTAPGVQFSPGIVEVGWRQTSSLRRDD